MRPTRVLSREHQVMLRFLETFGRLVEVAVRNRGVPPEDLAAALSFLADYGHAFHHVREEEHLFGQLQRVGLHRTNAPVAFLSSEHRRGHELLEGMRSHAQGAAAGEPIALRALVHLSRAFVDAEIDHIAKEDRILFPLADELLTPAADQVILAGFEEVRLRIGPDVLEHLLGSAERLRREYGPRVAPGADGRRGAGIRPTT